MKRGILCILLSILLLVPMFASCQQEADFTETEASVYTLYTIVDESTTDEAITQVELALNRILFYRLGVILKLEMVTESEYDKLIEDKFAEMEAYQLEKKNNKNTTSSASSDSEADASSEEIMTGDRILDLLEEGEEIPLDKPRLDIFLVRGYDKYYELATGGQLAALDEKLLNEAKALKSSIHSTLFTAAKVSNKTYGVPVNNAIGEYTYLAFDSELLDKYGFDANTLKSVEDLQDYLEVIKENEPDVVPLKSAKEPVDLNFLSNPGFPALVYNGEVINSYNNPAFKNFFAMLARYQTLGYLGDSLGETEESDATRYAVRIEGGNIDTINARLADTGYDYEYSLYSAPVATNETTIDNIFCVSKYVVSNELTDVMEIVTEINTDAQLMNLLTYGVLNENYVLNDDNQVERLNDSYIINPNYVGNCFITHTLKGENPEKWNNDIKQNQDAIVSPSLGFTSSLTKFTYTETVEAEDPNNPDATIATDVEVSVYEPDYLQILNSVVEEYYPKLLNGTAVEFDYDKFLTQATDEVTDSFIEKLNKNYEDNFLKPIFAERMRDRVTATRGAAIRQEVEDEVIGDFTDSVKDKLNNKLKVQFKEEFPEATEDEIKDKIKAALTDAYIQEHFSDYYSDEEVQEMIDEMYKSELEYEIELATDEVVGSAEYNAEFARLKNSAEYKEELDAMLEYDAPQKIQQRVDELISAEITTYTDEMIAKMETAVEEAVKGFIEEYKDILGLSEEEILIKIGYMKEIEAETEGDGETSGDASADTSTDTSSDTSSTESSDASSDTSADTSVESSDASVDVSADVSADASADTSDTTSDADGEDVETVPTYEIAYDSWFAFAFGEKIQKVYYVLYPLKTA
ncbi:MAG: hypothetical protein J6Q89_08475 [Clostridia bacterium]|nr:hypothetical protein [Clostridia bacterium]